MTAAGIHPQTLPNPKNAGNMLYMTGLKNVIARFRPGDHPFQGAWTEFLGAGSYFGKTSASCLKSLTFI